jgi:7-cyano-7-deazaguanine reductase
MQNEIKKDKYSDYLERRFIIQTEESIDPDILEIIPFKYAGSATEVCYETDEFTCVCPWTGLPDFGHLAIRYIPDQSLIELKSLKYYLLSYRNVGIIQEHAVNHVLQDLIQTVKPISMTVETEYRERGGIKSRVEARYKKE